MKYFKIFLAFFIISTSGLHLFSQNEVTSSKLDTDKLHGRIDSLTMVVDSILMDEFDIEKKKNKDGLVVHTAVGFKASTIGLGVEMVMSVHAKVNIRLSASYFQFTQTDEIYNGTVEADISHQNIVGGAYLFIDYQFNRWFHATAGLLYKVDKENGTVHPTSGLTIGGVEIPTEVLGHISYAIQNNGAAPYLGIGLGKSISLEKKIAFSANLGVYYYDNRTVELEATGMLSPTAIQKNTLKENAGNQTIYPFLGVQLTYRIF